MTGARWGLTVAAPVAAFGSQISGASVVGRVHVSPLELELVLSTHDVTVGKTSKATATIRNVAVAPVTGVVGDLRIDPVGVRVDAAARIIGVIHGGKRLRVAWRLCGRLPGIYVALVRVTGSHAGMSFATESRAVLLTVSADPRKTCRAAT